MKEDGSFRRTGVIILSTFLFLVSACASGGVGKDPLLSELKREAHQALLEGDLTRSRNLDLKALSINPNSPDTMNNLAVVQILLGQKKEALGTLRQAQRIDPRNPDILLNLAKVELRNGLVKEAFRTSSKIMRMEKWPNGFRTLMGKLDIDLGHYEEAQVFLHEAFERHPDDPLVLTYLGIVHFHLGLLNASKKEFRKALLKNPSPRLRSALRKLLRNPDSLFGSRTGSPNPKRESLIQIPNGSR